MGNVICIPNGHQEPPAQSRLDHADGEDLTMPSFVVTEADSCPYSGSHHRGTTSHSTSARPPQQPEQQPYKYANAPHFLTQLVQTAIILAGLGFVGFHLVQMVHLQEIWDIFQNLLESIPKAIQNLWDSLVAAFLKDLDFAWIFRKPADWWDTSKVNWDQPLLLEFWLALATLAAFAMDLLFSSEQSQGSPVLLLPTLLYSLIYVVISIHAQATKLLDPEIYQTFNAVQIGQKIFSQPEMVVMTFTHLFALDLGVAYAMMKDFYTRVTSRRTIYRLLMIVICVATIAQGVSTVPIYYLLRSTLFAGALINDARPVYNTNRNSHKRERDYLLDPIPRGSGAINGWIQSIPSPLSIPLVVFFVALGIVRFVAMLVSYFVYVFGFCMPVSALFFSLRRSWKLLWGKEIQGALYTPFETVNGKAFPFKAVLVVSAHLRLVCFKTRNNFIFNWTIGWWLRKYLEAYVMYEFTLPFKNDFSPYVAFLMEEFGPVFPMGQGLGFGAYKDVKAIIENKDQRKSGLSLAWSISTAQFDWSRNNLTSLPQTEIEKSIVAEGRDLVRCWLADVNELLKDDMVKKRLDAILPFANVDGTMIDKTLIDISFGSTLFHLLTGGEFTEHERHRYYKLLTNAFPFMSDWINKIWFGGILEFKGIQDYDLIRRAFLRYLEAPSLQKTLAMAEQNKWDAWTPPELVRFLVYKFCIAGGAAPAFILGDIVQKMYEDPKLVEVYKKDKPKFVLEMSRLLRAVPLVNFMAYDFKLPNGDKYVTIFNEKIYIPDGTPLHCSVQNANRDVTVFGADADKLNFNRDSAVIGKMMTFNGDHNEIMLGISERNLDYPARRCPGYESAMQIIIYLVDRYAPCSKCLEAVSVVSDQRLAEIQSRETFFQKIVLKLGQLTYNENNKYFPHASEVKHPLDCNGRELGSLMISASGDRYIPVYDEDVSIKENWKDELTSIVLKIAPITDDEGEWITVDEAIAWRRKWFNSNFPPVNTNYESYKSIDNMISEMAFAGICCLHTQKLDSLPKESLVRRVCKDSRAVFVNDTTALGSYRVRRGYQRYGAAAYFDADCHLIGVYTCLDGEYRVCPEELARAALQEDNLDVNPEHKLYDDWRHATWAWRVSALAFVTVVDHLVNVHMIAANSLVRASRTHLPINHPLRAFLKIFTYRTISINNKAYLTLTMRHGVINRNWAFEDDDLQELLFASKNTFKKNFRDYLPKSMEDVEHYPATKDLTEFANVVTKLVRDMLLVVYGSPGNKEGAQSRLQRNMVNDPALQAFLESLAGELGLVHSSDLASFDDIVDVLSSLICSVTGMHELVGQISDYFANPKICGTTIRRGKEIDSIQIYQLNCTLVSSTGLRMPRLMGNWEHLLTRNRFADDALPVLQTFQKELRELSIRIENDNATNRRFPMEAFNPTHLESSVSV